EQVGKQDAIGVDQRARAVVRAGGATAQHRVVEVADVTLAHEQAWEVLQRVLAVGRVDLLLYLIARDAFDGGRDLRRQRRGASADDGHGPQGLDLVVGLRADGTARERERRHSGRDERISELHASLRECGAYRMESTPAD